MKAKSCAKTAFQKNLQAWCFFPLFCWTLTHWLQHLKLQSWWLWILMKDTKFHSYFFFYCSCCHGLFPWKVNQTLNKFHNSLNLSVSCKWLKVSCIRYGFKHCCALLSVQQPGVITEPFSEENHMLIWILYLLSFQWALKWMGVHNQLLYLPWT